MSGYLTLGTDPVHHTNAAWEEAMRAPQALEDARQWAEAVRAWRALRPMAETIERWRTLLQHVDLCRAWRDAPMPPPHGCGGVHCQTVGCTYATPTLKPTIGWNP